MMIPIEHLSSFQQSKTAFWRMIEVARERGYVSVEDVSNWAEWEMSAWGLLGVALFYPLERAAAIQRVKEKLQNKELNADKFIDCIERTLSDLMHDRPEEVKLFFTAPSPPD